MYYIYLCDIVIIKRMHARICDIHGRASGMQTSCGCFMRKYNVCADCRLAFYFRVLTIAIVRSRRQMHRVRN